MRQCRRSLREQALKIPRQHSSARALQRQSSPLWRALHQGKSCTQVQKLITLSKAAVELQEVGEAVRCLVKCASGACFFAPLPACCTRRVPEMQLRALLEVCQLRKHEMLVGASLYAAHQLDAPFDAQNRSEALRSRVHSVCKGMRA